MSFKILSYTCATFLSISLLLAILRCCAKRNSKSQRVLTVGALCFCYYAVSISMSMVQKYLLVYFADGEFKFPLSMTVLHMSIKVAMAGAALGFPCLRPSAPTLLGVSSKNILRYVFPIGLATVADIALSNVSLLTVTLTLYIIVKTSSILFNYSFSVLLGLQKITWPLSLTVLGIFSGMVMASFHSTDFHFLGFIAVLVAAFCAASRWVVTERFFQHSRRKLKSIEVLYVVSPLTIPILLPFALVLELKPMMASHIWQERNLAIEGCFAVVGAGVTSFLLILLELAIVSRTSALTTDVLGYIKNVAMVVLAGLTYGDALSTLNVCGVVLAFSGALVYSIIKRNSGGEKPAGSASSERTAYEILSVLEMAQAWSDEDSLDEDPTDRLKADGGHRRHRRHRGRGRARGRSRGGQRRRRGSDIGMDDDLLAGVVAAGLQDDVSDGGGGGDGDGDDGSFRSEDSGSESGYRHEVGKKRDNDFSFLRDDGVAMPSVPGAGPRCRRISSSGSNNSLEDDELAGLEAGGYGYGYDSDDGDRPPSRPLVFLENPHM